MRSRQIQLQIRSLRTADLQIFVERKSVYGYDGYNIIEETNSSGAVVARYSPGSYDPSTPEGLALLGHELVHVGQYARDGLTRSAYLRELLKHGSNVKNKYEKPAYDKQTLIYLDLVANGDKCCSNP